MMSKGSGEEWSADQPYQSNGKPYGPCVTQGPCRGEHPQTKLLAVLHQLKRDTFWSVKNNANFTNILFFPSEQSPDIKGGTYLHSFVVADGFKICFVHFENLIADLKSILESTRAWLHPGDENTETVLRPPRMSNPHSPSASRFTSNL